MVDFPEDGFIELSGSLAKPPGWPPNPSSSSGVGSPRGSKSSISSKTSSKPLEGSL